mmetsp:Transcript_14715/g.41855  ORF Transcript_14715/g.41855 Transcript_14715/m.41855 type:complete len:710 (-) Transcript_14715:231-2360(-)|eukprot:CAMPEP_0119127888 /NCGR_PEP_ID=MMETSP1310-20130426/6257_1 /TAXON_ID=464262 /ORGANISM="Genus nov. species nov., Strain RCC2339" /LENGTH=709 /DNA_ID=CAMNT_0007118173 /DNA_START=71 /DNA_END=2200 /DNA_ORIENTATION=+
MDDQGQRKALLQSVEKNESLLSLVGTDSYPTAVPEVDVESLDITNEEIDFDELDDLIEKFQQDERVKEALLKGVDMRDYGKQIDGQLKDEQAAAVQDYILVTEDLLRLHSEITGCDEILSRMEKLLSGFQADLGNISTEIKALQDQSSSLSVQLNNRKEVCEKLSAYIDSVAVSSQLIRCICDAEVNEAYIAYIIALNRKMMFVRHHKKTNPNTASIRDVEPQLRKLRDKAVLKIRKFLLLKISSLQRPQTNTSILQQNVLLKYKLLHSFLRKHNKDIANEVRRRYIDTITDIYLSNSEDYIDALMRLHKPIGYSSDLLGAPEDTGKGWFSFRFDAERTCIFTLNKRNLVIQDILSPPLIAHEEQSRNRTYPYECLFRSMNCFLIDVVTAEYHFCNEFFGKDTDTFSPICKRVIEPYVTNIQRYLGNCYDCVGILLVIRLARGIQQALLSRRVTVLQNYFQTIAGFLWPRFSELFSLHIDSVVNAGPPTIGESVHTRPHFVVRRYGELIAAIRVIGVTYSDGRLEKSLGSLRAAMDGFVEKLKRHVPDPKLRVVLLINNYDLVLSLLESHGVESEERKYFHKLREKNVGIFVDLELATYLDSLVAFVKKCQEQPDVEQAHPALVGKLVKGFASNWKSILEAINRDVMTSYFSNFRNGADVLKKVLTKLVYYYNTFGEILKKGFKQSAIMRDFVPPTTVTYEIAKYAIEF